MADAKHDDHSAKKDDKKNSFFKTGLGKAFYGLIAVAVVGMVLLALFSASDSGQTTTVSTMPSRPIEAPIIKVAKQTSDSDCGKTVGATLNFGERMVHGGYCKVLAEDVVQGVVLFHYNDGSEQTVSAGGVIQRKTTTGLSWIAGISNVPAIYKGHLGLRGQP